MTYIIYIALFRCEDERFEVDMIIDSNMCTIRLLEPVAEEIKLLKMSDEADSAVVISSKINFQMDKKHLSAIHLFSIARIYGEHGNEILGRKLYILYIIIND